MRYNRLKEIEKFIISNESVSLDDIASKFSISISTVRRDVRSLLSKGGFFKVYGGISHTNKKDRSSPYVQRSEKKQREKDAIAKKAAEIIEPNDVIFVDSGTTTYRLVKHVNKNINITIITASVSAMFDALSMPNIRLISLPGELDRDTNSFCGLDTVSFLDSYNINKSFLSAVGISSSGEVTNASMLEHDIKIKAIQKSKENILLVDNNKYNLVSLLSYGKITDFNSIYTDYPANSEFEDLCNRNNVKLIQIK